MHEKVAIITEYLNTVKTRCTYNAAAEAIGITPLAFKKCLDGNKPENSWYVSASSGNPTGYSDDEKHPELYRTKRIIKSAEVLTRNLDI